MLSFVATNVVQAAFFGFYGGDGSPAGTMNRERLGEIMLFESAMSDSARADIEAYLMKKWLGKARAGYSDMTAAIISGTGTVSASAPSYLPSFDSGFNGAVALSGTSFDYTLATNAFGAYEISPATVLPGVLSVAATGTVNVHFEVRPPAGTYPLIICDAIAGDGFANWTLSITGEAPTGTVSLKANATALNLAVTSQGTLFMLQ